MKHSRTIILALFIVAALLAVFMVVGQRNCPSEGLALTPERRTLHRLKNRTALPTPADFNNAVTLSSLLEPGADSNRWSASQAGRIEGYVVSVAPGPLEATNCFALGRRDTHIHIGTHSNAAPAQQIVLETTPLMEDWARQQGWDWSAQTLNKTLVGRRVRFEGWLLFDSTHADDSENIAPLKPGNWRATAWEIHPVTRFQILD